MELSGMEYYKEIQKAMELNQAMQGLYGMFMSIMGFPEQSQSMSTGSSNIFLNNINSSTAEFTCASKSNNISANF